MFRLLLAATVSASIVLTIVAYPQGSEAPPSESSQCAQYQAQCKNGSATGSEGSNGMGAVFPNNPRPTSSSFNQTAAEQLPYCQGLAQACESQTGNSQIPTQPTQPPAGGGRSFINSVYDFFGFA